MQPIPLAALLPADFDPATCKLHCAVFNGKNYPIDVLANDPEEWQRWNSWRGDKNDFNRQFIFSLAQDRHDPTLWLFGGIWEVMARRPEPRTYSYDVIPREDLMGSFVRRLYVRLHLVACRGLVLLDGGVEVAELEAGVFGGEVPVDLALAGVGRLLPRGEFGVEDVEVVDPAVEALAGQGGELDLGDVEPGPVFGGVVDLESLGQREGLVWFEGLVERGDAVGVEVG